MSRQDILKAMLIDEDALFERLVERAGQVFKIDKRGNIVFLVSSSRLTYRQRIALVMLGRYFAAELGIFDTDTVKADDLLSYIDTDRKNVSARLAELKKEGIVESVERGTFRISVLGIRRIFDEIATDQ